VAVALGEPVVGALVGGGADHRGQLRFDQRLVDGLGGLPNPIGDVGGLE
jgi:hypothetical protein